MPARRRAVEPMSILAEQESAGIGAGAAFIFEDKARSGAQRLVNNHFPRLQHADFAAPFLGVDVRGLNHCRVEVEFIKIAERLARPSVSRCT